MADEDNAGGTVKGSSLTEAEAERIARRAADAAVADLLRRLGIDPEHPEKWRSFFAEVNPIQARESVAHQTRRRETDQAVLNTLKSRFVDWLLMGILSAVIAGIATWVKTK